MSMRRLWVDVDEALVGAALELLTAVLVLVDGAQDGDDLGLGRQGDGAGDLGVGALGGLDDGLGCLVDELVIVSLETDADHVFACCHGFAFSFFVRFCSGGIGSADCVRMKPRIPVHTTVRIRPRPKNKPAFLAGSRPGPRDIRVYRWGFSRPIAYRKRPVPDILHGSYLVSEQSPASSQCGRAFARALQQYSRTKARCQGKFCDFRRIFH